MTKTVLVIFLFVFIFSCKDENKIENKPTESRAIPVYNQAYQENYESDRIEDIIENAKNAYVLIDPFENNVHLKVSEIKAKGNEVGAYISIGTGENWRTDFSNLQPYLVSEEWGEWEGEYFVNSVTTGIIDVMKIRIDSIAKWGCDWVEFDNMDWAFDEDSRELYGFQVSESEAIAYYNELCDYAHEKGIKCMAKNTVENATNFDGALYESYNNDKNWWNQSGAQSFLDAGKLVIVNHYNETNCGQVYSEYKGIYNNDLSFICEDANKEKYVHFNE